MNMIQLFRSAFPKEFYGNPIYFQAILLGILYLASLLTQLFTFEKFDKVTIGFALYGGSFTASMLTWLLPLTALAALPFLMSMRMSSVLRTISKTAVVALPLFWLTIGLWTTIVVGDGSNSGLLGASVAIPSGIWLVAVSILWLWVAIIFVQRLPKRI